MPEYTIRIVNEMQYHVDLNEADGIRVLFLNNNGQYITLLDDDAAFVQYIYALCEEIKDAYDMSQNKDYDAIQQAGLDWTDHYDEDLDEDEADIPYHEYVYPIVEYLINGQEATITLADEVDQYGQARAGEIIETEDQVRVREQYAAQQPARSKFYDDRDLVPNGIIPRVVAVGTTYTLEQFRQLGPFRIQRKLFYDDFDMSAEEVDCTFQQGHKEYPVLTIPQNQIYCMKEILPWVLTKNTDPNTRGIIEQFRIMNEEDIEKKELEELTKGKGKKRIRDLEQKIEERKTEKIRRKNLNRLLNLKF